MARFNGITSGNSHSPSFNNPVLEINKPPEGRAL
jgi:hypothetical protein